MYFYWVTHTVTAVSNDCIMARGVNQLKQFTLHDWCRVSLFTCSFRVGRLSISANLPAKFSLEGVQVHTHLNYCILIGSMLSYVYIMKMYCYSQFYIVLLYQL